MTNFKTWSLKRYASSVWPRWSFTTMPLSALRIFRRFPNIYQVSQEINIKTKELIVLCFIILNKKHNNNLILQIVRVWIFLLFAIFSIRYLNFHFPRAESSRKTRIAIPHERVKNVIFTFMRNTNTNLNTSTFLTCKTLHASGKIYRWTFRDLLYISAMHSNENWVTCRCNRFLVKGKDKEKHN